MLNYIIVSGNKELVELPVGTLRNCPPVDNNVELRADMFGNADQIMRRICSKSEELGKLYEKLASEQDKLRRINMYAYNRKVEANPQIEMCKLWDRSYVSLSVPEKLPKNTHVVFTVNSGDHSTFCVKEVMETMFTVNVPVDKGRVSHSSTVSIDLITLMNKETPWCIVQDFITCPLQKVRKRSKREIDKTTFIEAKIALLRNLMAERKLTLDKLSEVKKDVRAELEFLQR